MKDVNALTDIFRLALNRAKEGNTAYGEFNPETDKRKMPMEALEEILDALVYIGFEIYKYQQQSSTE